MVDIGVRMVNWYDIITWLQTTQIVKGAVKIDIRSHGYDTSGARRRGTAGARLRPADAARRQNG